MLMLHGILFLMVVLAVVLMLHGIYNYRVMLHVISGSSADAACYIWQ